MGVTMGAIGVCPQENSAVISIIIGIRHAEDNSQLRPVNINRINNTFYFILVNRRERDMSFIWTSKIRDQKKINKKLKFSLLLS